MKLHSTSIHVKTQQFGFTLMEVLVVLGLLSIFATMGLAFSFDSYRGYVFRGEYTTAVNLLARARNRAINNFNESNHGVAITPTEYRLYATAIYNPNDDTTYESYPRGRAVSIPNIDIIFEELTGNSICGSTPCEHSLTFGYNAQTKTITVNEAGGIMW